MVANNVIYILRSIPVSYAPLLKIVSMSVHRTGFLGVYGCVEMCVGIGVISGIMTQSDSVHDLMCVCSVTTSQTSKRCASLFCSYMF